MALNISPVLVGLLCITLGASAYPQNDVPAYPPGRSPVTDMKLLYSLNVEGQRTHENVELNYDENYARVRTPALGNRDAMTMIHDYNQGLTLYKQNGRCFMLNQYDDFPRKMEDWLNLDYTANGGVIEAEGEDGYTLHNYKVVPFALNRTALPVVMRRECDEIDMMVLQNTVKGGEAYYDVETSTCNTGAIYLPSNRQTKAPGGRAKRDVAAPCHICYVNSCSPGPKWPDW